MLPRKTPSSPRTILQRGTESLLFLALPPLVSEVRPKVTPPPFLHNHTFHLDNLRKDTKYITSWISAGWS